MEIAWLIKLLLAHMLTDFLLQPKSWIESRNDKHFASPGLYLHGFITALVALVFIGWNYWNVAVIILITHTIIDGWKSYQKQNITYFLIDQLMHIVIIIGCWTFYFLQWNELKESWSTLTISPRFWMLCLTTVFVTTPTGFLIGFLTKKWREQIPGSENLANAGKWIGITERLIILIFVIMNQYSAIGLLVAAKGIIRFNERDRQEIKTEYLVIGTLISMVVAIGAGLLTKMNL